MCDGILYDISSHGLHAKKMPEDGWILIPVKATLDVADEFFDMNGVLNYDFFSLLAFQLPLTFKDSSRMYCFEWCWYILTGENPGFKVTPERLLTKVLEMQHAT